MVERDFITLPRVGDDAPMSLRHSEIVMVVANATEAGPIEGTAAIYMRHGLGVAVNVPPEEVLAAIAAKEITQ